MSAKAYLFLTPSISALGGAERYMAGKVSWLISAGWDVFIAGPCPNTPAVDYCSSRIFDIRGFNLRPFTLTEAGRRLVTGDVVATLCRYEQVFIESSTICFGFWGEYLASQLGAEHMIFHLSEEVPKLSMPEIEWLKRKYGRREVFFIKEGIARLALGSVADGRGVLTAYMTSPIEDCECDSALLNKRTYRLGCISRLDKPFLIRAVEELVSFARKHPECSFEVVIIGGATDPSRDEEWKARLSEIVQGRFPLLMPGGMAPIPRALVKSFDFGFGKSGGSSNLACEGVPTLTYSMDTDEPMGVFGFDFARNVCADDGESVDTVSVLERALIEGKYIGQPMPMIVTRKAVDYAKHFKAFGSHDGPRDLLVPIRHASVKERLKGLTFTLFGPRGYGLLKRLFRGGC